MADMTQFIELLKQLQSVDNDARSQAETAYDGLEAPFCLSSLLQCMENSNLSGDMRVFSAVLCRRLLMHKYNESFKILSEETQSGVKNQLLLIMFNEPDYGMRKKICDVACELVQELTDDSENHSWPEFAEFMLKCSTSDDAGLRELACYILTNLPTIFGQQTEANMQLIFEMLGRALSDQLSGKVRAAAVCAMSAFTSKYAEDFTTLQIFKPLLPPVLQTIAASVQADPNNEELLKALVQIAESAPKFLRPEIKSSLELCYQILTNQELSDSMRHLALEVIITISENMPAAVRKVAENIIGPLVETLLDMMCELEEDPEWEMQDCPEEDEGDTNAVTAELALDRFACGLGSQHVLMQIIQKVPAMLHDADWRRRQAGLMAVSACAEGCQKQMEAMLASVLEAVIPRLTDPHPRVRHAACNAIGQMALDFGPKLQKAHHATVIPALMHVLDDSCARVQAIAGAAIVNFCEKTPKNILSQYLSGLIAKLEQVMTAKFHEMVDKGRRLVLEQIVTTVASVADAAEEDFAPYYDRFMPVLKYIMEQATHPDLRMLRGKTIECISLIGLAVGKDKFINDAAPIMNLLLSTQTSQTAGDNANGPDGSGGTMDADDPQISFMIGAWARICKLMGAEFEPYLPLVMPQVLQTASIKPDICLVDDDQASAVDDDFNWQVVKLNQNQNFAIRTSGLEDKSTACRMLLCYARELKQTFAPYCEKVLEIMIPTLKFYFNDEVRDAAAEIMPYLLDSIKLSRCDLVPQVWQRICAALLEAVSHEPDREIVADQLEAIAGCVQVLGDQACNVDGTPNALTTQQLTDIHYLLDRMFHEHFEKDDERVAKRHDEDYDEVEEERLMSEKDDDEYVMSKIYEVMHAIFTTHKVHALSFFKSLMLHCVNLLKADRPWSDLQWGLCFWGDVVEFGGEEAYNLREYYLPVLANSLGHSEAEVRQNAASTVGLIAMFGSDSFLPLLTEMVPSLLRIIEQPNSRDENNNTCTENAISALTKMMKYKPACLQPQVLGCSMEQFLQKWLTWLPIWEDDLETEHVYGYLCDLVESNNPHVLGQDNCNLPHIVRALAQTFATEGLTSKTGVEDLFGNPIPTKNGQKSIWDRCVALLRQIHSNEALFECCVRNCDDVQKKALATSLNLA